MDIEVWFWSMVDKRGISECWPWKGKRDKAGYGFFSYKGRPYRTNRFVVSLFSDDPLDAGELAMHSCDNPPCCNPYHLGAGTYKDNFWDMVHKGRHDPHFTPAPDSYHEVDWHTLTEDDFFREGERDNP